MSKQIQSASRYSSENIAETASTSKKKEVSTEEPSNYWPSSSSAPEISIYPAEGEAVESEPLEIDSFTGLPKLPVELPPASPETPRKFSSALKMDTSPSKRKSVTFGPAAQGSSKVCVCLIWHASHVAS